MRWLLVFLPILVIASAIFVRPCPDGCDWKVTTTATPTARVGVGRVSPLLSQKPMETITPTATLAVMNGQIQQPTRTAVVIVGPPPIPPTSMLPPDGYPDPGGGWGYPAP